MSNMCTDLSKGVMKQVACLLAIRKEKGISSRFRGSISSRYELSF